MAIGIHPTVSCATDPSLKFPSQKPAHDPENRVRFANIQSIRSVRHKETDTELRVLRGILNITKTVDVAGKKTIRWPRLQWEAIYRPRGADDYSCDAIIIASHRHYWIFTRKQLRRVAEKPHMTKKLALVEHIALFMDGCLASFAKNHARVIATDMHFEPPVHRYGK